MKKPQRTKGTRQSQAIVEATSRGAAPVAPPATGSDARDSLPPLYSVREVAQHFKVSRNTVRRLVSTGVLPHYRIGNQLRFDILVVRSVLDKHT